MADDVLLAFNRGVVSPLALARVDIKRVAMSAQEQCNWTARTLGPMSVRPGTGYLGTTKSNLAAKSIPFVFSTTDTALIELTDTIMRVRINDVLVTRPSVATTITNGNFTSDLSSWTDNDDVGATSSWGTGGYMILQGDGTNAAIRDQQLTIATGDQNVEHALNITVTINSVFLRVGSTLGDDDYVTETELIKGTNSIAFTPTGGAAYIRLFNRRNLPSYLDNCTMAPAGVMELSTTLTSDLFNSIRTAQSGDVVFLSAGLTHRPLRIERRSVNSWSIVDYVFENGPFKAPNVTPTTITSDGLNGAVTLTSSKPLFKSSNVGGLIKVNSGSQTVFLVLSAANTFTNPIRVSGVGDGRLFSYQIQGTWSATVTLQRSVGAPGAWVDVNSYTTNVLTNLTDGFDNQIVYYRLGIKVGNYTSGSAKCSMWYTGGTITGIARITAYTSATSVFATVYQDFGSTDPSRDWSEGSWSPRRGFPAALAFFGGRLWWAGKDKVWGSVVDAFDSFDEDYVGDAGPISRSIGSGPVDSINWLLSLQTLTLGAQGAEFLCRSSSLEEPLTPTNFNLRETTTWGSTNVEAAKIDASGIFVDRTGSHIMEAVPDYYGNLQTQELTIINPSICLPGIVRLSIQRRPDTRVHLIRSDGVAVILVFDKAEDVKCLITVETDGLIEDVAVLPGIPEDQVYYTVNRTVNGSTVRYLERWALTSEAIGGTVNKMADAFVVYSGVSTATINGLSHLEGKTVCCWANSKDQGTFVVSGGSITLPEATTYAVTGLVYEARFNSAKVGTMVFGPNVIGMGKRIERISLVMANTHYQGLQYGQDATHLDDLPLVENGAVTPADYIWGSYDQDSFPLNGSFSSPDTRLYLRGQSPRPCTVMAAVVSIDKGSR